MKNGMGKVGVFHPFFGKGGAETVCLNVLESIQDEHQVDLLTASNINVESYNNFFNTAVSTDITIRTVTLLGWALSKSLHACRTYAGHPLGRLHAGPFVRCVHRYQTDYDLIISTFNEFGFERPSLSYIHYPAFGRYKIPDYIENTSLFRDLYDVACQHLSGHDADAVRESTLLTNSEWTADIVETIYGIRPHILYPPVDTTGFNPLDWSDREDGFVMIGRIDPLKNIRRNITILDRVRRMGHDIHAHIIGPIPETEYADEVRKATAGRSYVSLEDAVDRSKLVEFVCTHKYGIHGMDHEHFGIVVAEMVAGGILPFVPNNGGQREIVQQDPKLTYESVTDAVEMIDTVLSDVDIQHDIRVRLPDVESKYGKVRFQDKISTIINKNINSGESL